MHSKENDNSPHASNKEKIYTDIIADISEFLEQRITFAKYTGISEHQIILDPGMGKFLSNNPDDSWELLERFDELCNHFKNFPVLVGVSRKGFLGGAIENRDVISQETALKAVNKGGRIIRTHNVSMMHSTLLGHSKTN